MTRARHLLARLGLLGAVAGCSATGVLAGLALERRLVTDRIYRRHRREDADDGDDADGGVPLGSLRSVGRVVVTPDGVGLHAEVDEPTGPTDDLTLVFVHGYALSLDCWHFQRLHVRGRVRSVFYDQRSHGRSGRSAAERCRIPQLTDDLVQVLEEVAGPGPVVLVGHSMGGMTIMRLAQTRPDLFGERVRGVALFSTAAGQISDYSPIPGLRGETFSRLAPLVLATLNRLPVLADRNLGSGSDLGYLLTRRLSFGSAVTVREVEFMSTMLAVTPLAVVADFYPAFAEVDEYRALEVLRRVPTAVVGGEDDLVTPLDHTNRILALLPDADGRRLAHCGHLGILEHPEVFNLMLDHLVERVRERHFPGQAAGC